MFFALLIAAQPAALQPPPFPGSPPWHDAYRFPGSDYCRAQLAFNDRFRLNITEERRAWPLNRQAIWAATIDEAVELREVWEVAANVAWGLKCRPDNGPESDKYIVAGLHRLRELLGDEDYEAARMPPCVPTWRLRQLR